MSSELIVEKADSIVRLTINRPDVRNAINLKLVTHLVETIIELSKSRSTRVFVLTGAGERAFISGADTREFKEQLATAESALNYDLRLEVLQSTLRSIPQPVIAMIRGHAVGSGMLIAAACDFRIAVRSAKFGIPVAKFGFFIPVPDSLRLIQLIGLAKTRWMLMSGQLIDATEAEKFGFVDQVVEANQLMQAVDTLAKTLAENAPLSLKITKSILEEIAPRYHNVHSTNKWYSEIYNSHDVSEGIAAFLFKRKPTFVGK